LKTSVKILIAVIAVAVLGIGAAAAVILSADPYKKAETAYVTELMPFSKNVKYLDGYSGAYDIEYEMDESLVDMLGTEMGPIALWGDFDMLTSKQRISAYLTEVEDTSEEKQDTIGGEAFVDSNMIYLTMPGITDYVFTAEIEDAPELPELDTAKLLKTGTAVSDIYFDMAKEYGEYGDGEFENGGETFKADTFTIDFTGEMINNFTIGAIDEIEKNESIMGYLQVLAEVDGGDAEDLIDALLESAENLEDEYGSDTIFTMTVYIKGGKIIGREFYNFYDDEDILIQLYDTEKGSARNQLIKMSDEDDKIEYKGDYEKQGGKYSGTASFVMTSYGEEVWSITADVEGFEYYPEGGFADGYISIETELDDYGSGMTLEIDMQKDGLTQFATITGEVATEYTDEPINIGTITMSITVDPDNPTISAPEFDEDYAIDLDDPDYDKMELFMEDISAYQDSLDHDGVIYMFIDYMLMSSYY
jgi:hypothetical protein